MKRKLLFACLLAFFIGTLYSCAHTTQDTAQHDQDKMKTEEGEHAGHEGMQH